MPVSLQNSNAQLDAAVLDRGITPRSKIPQLEDVAVYLYGHSNAALLGTSYYTTGRHWSNLLAETNVGSVANSAVAGSTMEQQSIYMLTGTTPWPSDTNKKLALIQAVGNSAGASGAQTSEAAHLTSFKNAVETISAMTLGDYISEQLPNAQWAYSAGWTQQGLAAYGGSVGYYTQTPGAYAIYTVPAGVSNKRIWAMFLEGDYRTSPQTWAPVTIRRNDGGGAVDVSVGVAMNTAVALSGSTPSYTRRAIDCGVYSAGQLVAIYHAGTGSQTLFFDGLRMENTRNHACFIEDNPDWMATNATEWTQWLGNPGFGPDRLERFNQALRDQVASINSRVTNAASTFSTRDATAWPPTQASQYAHTATDHIHYNDYGNAYQFAKVSQGLARTIPWTARLHTGIQNG